MAQPIATKGVGMTKPLEQEPTMGTLCEVQLAFGDVARDVGQDGPARGVVDGFRDGDPADQLWVLGGHGGVNPTAWRLRGLQMGYEDKISTLHTVL